VLTFDFIVVVFIVLLFILFFDLLLDIAFVIYDVSLSMFLRRRR